MWRQWEDNHLHLVTLNGPDEGGNGDPYFMLLIDPFLDYDLISGANLRFKTTATLSFPVPL